MILYYLCLILELSRAKSVLLYLVISVEIMSVNICRISILFTSVMNTQLSAVYIYKYQVKTISSTSLLTFNTISTSTFLVANSHSSNSSSWSLCMSVGLSPDVWQHFHLVHYLNYLKLSLSNCSFGTFSTLVLSLSFKCIHWSMKPNKGFKQLKTHLFATGGFLNFLVFVKLTTKF